MADIDEPSPFMQFPTEIRLLIYALLLRSNGTNIFAIRSEAPERYKLRGQHRRTAYRELNGTLLQQCQQTTYHLVSDGTLRSMLLRKLVLRVIGGQSSSGWDGMPQYAASDFKTLTTVGFEGVEWIRELVDVKSLQELQVIPEIEQCSSPKSSAMLFFQAFSASIDKGFADYLQSEMLLTES